MLAARWTFRAFQTSDVTFLTKNFTTQEKSLRPRAGVQLGASFAAFKTSLEEDTGGGHLRRFEKN
jgi:hypothetical protein